MTKPIAGDIIIFDQPIEFQDGSKLKELQLIERSKFINPITNKGYWVTSWRKFAYSIKREGELLGRPDRIADFRIQCRHCFAATQYDALDTVTGMPCDKCGGIL